ncbi:hypothetical protein F5Y03DRAFT_371605 [Xylaria venustula]|nr:hypothetical protein F5Y03DRAFT_371605 [Xylaria venustula]
MRSAAARWKKGGPAIWKHHHWSLLQPGFLALCPCYMLWRYLEPGSTGRMQGFELPSIKSSAPAETDATRQPSRRVPDVKWLWKNEKSQMNELFRESWKSWPECISCPYSVAGQMSQWDDAPMEACRLKSPPPYARSRAHHDDVRMSIKRRRKHDFPARRTRTPRERWAIGHESGHSSNPSMLLVVLKT